MIKRGLRIDPSWLCIFIILVALLVTNGGQKLPKLKSRKPLTPNIAHAAEKDTVNPASIPANAGETIAAGSYGQAFRWELADGSHTIVVTQRDGGSVLSKPLVIIDDMQVPEDELVEVVPSTYKVSVPGWPLKLSVLSLPATEEHARLMLVSVSVAEGAITVDNSVPSEPQPSLALPGDELLLKQYYQPGVGIVHDCSVLNAQSVNEFLGALITLGNCTMIDHRDR